LKAGIVLKADMH